MASRGPGSGLGFRGMWCGWRYSGEQCEVLRVVLWSTGFLLDAEGCQEISQWGRGESLALSKKETRSGP